MTTALLNPNSVMVPSGTNFAAAPKGTKLGNGNMLVKGLKVFRAGTFKDSMGIQRTWEVSHLEQMVFHFNLLKDQRLFENVPVREDHSWGVRGVVGYFQDVRREDNFLVADIEFTEPGAYDKYLRGTYRARSLEVNAYETNDEAMYWPCVMGVAFVDIGAVEGLHSARESSDKGLAHFSQVMQDDDKEPPVAETETQAPAPTAPVTTPEPAQQPAPETTAPAQEQEEENKDIPAPEATPAPAAPATQGAAAHSHGAFSFSINGQTTTDYSAVQAHIKALKGSQAEARDLNRKNFVTSLANKKVIAATQVDDLTEFALSLDENQYAAFARDVRGSSPRRTSRPAWLRWRRSSP